MYTIEGDAWSFGILLSEICSLGNNPYVQFRSLSNDFIDFLSSGGKCRVVYCAFLFPLCSLAANLFCAGGLCCPERGSVHRSKSALDAIGQSRVIRNR